MEAYTEGSSLTADQGISLSAASTATINATVDATSVAVAASTSGTAVGGTAAGVSTDNEIYLTIYAGIDGGTGVLAKQGNISVTAIRRLDDHFRRPGGLGHGGPVRRQAPRPAFPSACPWR